MLHSTYVGPVGMCVISIAHLWDSMPDRMSQLGETSAQALAVSVSSVVFGALHAVTPLNFFWATAVRQAQQHAAVV